MTRSTAILRTRGAGHVLSMIELHVEGLFELVRESFQWWVTAAHAGVTDRAHGHTGVGELRQVTGGAIFVAGEAGPHGIIISMMAARARRRCVTCAGVQEFRVVEIVSLGESQGQRKK